MFKRFVSMLLLIAAFFIFIDPVWCGSIIGQATLHITLYVPPKPVTADTVPGTYPEYTVSFVRLTLVVSAIDILSNTLINLQTATGKIRNYQLVVGGILMMNFPLSYLCLKLGLSPVSVYIVAIVVAVCCLFLRLLFLRRMVEKFSMSSFLRNVSVNVLKVVLAASIIPLLVTLLMDDSWIRLLLFVPFSMLSTVCSIVWIGCSVSERSFIFGKLAFACKKIGL